MDWKGIDDAAYWIGHKLARYGRISVRDMKEKYGTVRVYCSLGHYQLYCILFPMRLWIRGPLSFTSHIRIPNWVNGLLIVPYQAKVYRMVYRLAIKRWPHLREEILSCADFDELLTGL